jgi:tetratricopeptide (TPR) repeat protein/transcriptional regulator with XRE-family HTH domain
MTEFGPELRRLREAAGLSLTALALAIPASKGYLSKIENGHIKVNRGIAEACDKALGAKGELLALVHSASAPTRPVAHGLVGLPYGTRHFVGRTAELETLSSMLAQQDAVRICVVHGMAGVGKTAVAIAAARSVTGDFPDGCLFFDFQGHTRGAPVLTPAEGLRRVLALLDVPGDKIPSDVDGRANLLQALLAERRMLLVFDNVRTADQVRLMVPAGPGCRVIITSRSRLQALDDACSVPLDVLPTADALKLFRSVAGPSVRDDDNAVADIAAQCGMLPLALRIAAARFVGGGWTTAGFADRLADQNTRLSSLDDGERSVNSAFKVSYEALPDDQRRLFGLLALYPSTAAEVTAVNALADLAPGEGDRLLDRLHDAHLLTRTARGYIELHDLMRTFAVRYALSEISSADQAAAMGRLVGHVMARVHAADQLLEPHRFRLDVDIPAQRNSSFDDAATALGWLRAQWPTLAQVIELAPKFGYHRQCWQLVYVLRSFFFRERLLEPWITTHQLALDCARQAGDVAGAGMILNNLGMVHLEVGRLTEAVECHDRAWRCFRQAGDERGATDAISSRAWTLLAAGDLAGAHRDLAMSLVAYRETGRPHNIAIALRGMAFVLTAMGRFDEATSHVDEARNLARIPHDVLMTINCGAWIHYRAGRFADAGREYQAALEVAEHIDSDYEIARSMTGLGNAIAQQGDHETAERWWAQADGLDVPLNPQVSGEAWARANLAEAGRRRAGVPTL